MNMNCHDLDLLCYWLPRWVLLVPEAKAHCADRYITLGKNHRKQETTEQMIDRALRKRPELLGDVSRLTLAVQGKSGQKIDEKIYLEEKKKIGKGFLDSGSVTFLLYNFSSVDVSGMENFKEVTRHNQVIGWHAVESDQLDSFILSEMGMRQILGNEVYEYLRSLERVSLDSVQKRPGPSCGLRSSEV